MKITTSSALTDRITLNHVLDSIVEHLAEDELHLIELIEYNTERTSITFVGRPSEMPKEYKRRIVSVVSKICTTAIGRASNEYEITQGDLLNRFLRKMRSLMKSTGEL